VAKKISMPMVSSAQSMHLYWAEINTISKRIEACFHLTHVTKKFRRVRPKWFLNLLHIRRKPCPYLMWLSPNRLKWASIWPKSPRSSIECAQNDFQACGPFIPNHAPILRRD
jgi:hypothetical protein